MIPVWLASGTRIAAKAAQAVHAWILRAQRSHSGERRHMVA